MQTQLVRTNLSRILDTFQWHLQQMSPENGYLCGPVVVNRQGDNRALKVDQAQQFRAYMTRVTFKLADMKLLRGSQAGMRGTLGGVKRYAVRLEFIVNQALAKPQDETGITLDMIQEWFRLDLAYNILHRIDNQGRQTFLSSAATALNAADPTWGPAPSCINPLVTEILHGPALAFPNAVMVCRVEFAMDEQIRSFQQTNL